MGRLNRLGALAAGLLGGLGACANAFTEDAPASNACASCEPTLAGVQAIFARSCTGPKCHDAAEPADGLDLATQPVDARLVGVTAESCEVAGPLRVVPGDPEASVLHQKLTQKLPACGDHMPPSGKLCDAQIECIRGWIESLSPIADAGGSDG